MTQRSSSSGRARRSPPEIADVIRGLIREGEAPPGAHLGTVELAETLGVSRGPVREALRLLESAGIVKIVPRKGAFVAALSDQEVRDALAIREVLFALLAQRCAEQVQEKDAEALHSAMKGLEALAHSPDTRAADFQMETHRYVGVMHRIARSPRLKDMMRDLSMGAAEVWGHLSMATRDMRAVEVEGYWRLTEAITTGDTQAAFAAARRMHAAGVARATELNASLPWPTRVGAVELKGVRRRRSAAGAGAMRRRHA